MKCQRHNKRSTDCLRAELLRKLILSSVNLENMFVTKNCLLIDLRKFDITHDKKRKLHRSHPVPASRSDFVFMRTTGYPDLPDDVKFSDVDVALAWYYLHLHKKKSEMIKQNEH